MKLSIVIPVFNKSAFTKSCLEDLKSLDHEVIVVDNASTDNTEEIVKQFPVMYIKNATNLGFGKACNIGFSKATGDAVMFLNNDIRVKSNHDSWTKPILEAIDSDKSIFAGPTVGYLDNKLEFIKESNSFSSSLKNVYMSGWCLTAKKSTFIKLAIPRKEASIIPQIFNEEYFAYFEDTDLSFRAKKLADFEMKIVPIPVVHFGKQTSLQKGLNTYLLYSQSKKVFMKHWNQK